MLLLLVGRGMSKVFRKIKIISNNIPEDSTAAIARLIPDTMSTTDTQSFHVRDSCSMGGESRRLTTRPKLATITMSAGPIQARDTKIKIEPLFWGCNCQFSLMKQGVEEAQCTEKVPDLHCETGSPPF